MYITATYAQRAYSITAMHHSALPTMLFTLAAFIGAAAAAGLPDGVISIPLKRIINQTFYGMEFAVGNPPQISTLKVDTGSVTIGFNTPSSNLCVREDKPCALYGTYDNLTSTSAEPAFPDRGYPDYFDSLIDHGSGLLVNDTLSFGDVHFPNATFGTYDNYAASYPIANPAAGIMGLGAYCYSGNACTDYPTLVQQLTDRGVLRRRAFSVYLGPDDPDAVGTLLLGGVDKAKQAGPVIKMPLTIADDFPLQINYTSLELRQPGNTTAFTIDPGSYSFWDTGNWMWRFPTPAFNAIAQALGIPDDVDSTASAYPVDCAKREIENATVAVGFPGGESIQVPLGHLVSRLDDGSCISQIGAYEGNGGPSEPGNAFGAPFLRSVYVTFDLDDLTVSFSKARYTTDEDIHLI